jgi:hypothetical protein
LVKSFQNRSRSPQPLEPPQTHPPDGRKWDGLEAQENGAIRLRSRFLCSLLQNRNGGVFGAQPLSFAPAERSGQRVRHSAVVRPASERTVYQTLALKRAEISRLPTDIAQGTDGSPFGAAAAAAIISMNALFQINDLLRRIERDAEAIGKEKAARRRLHDSNL